LGGIDVRLQILNKQGTLEFESNNSFFQDLFRVVRQQQQQYGNENDVYRFIDELIQDPESELVNT
jgi:polyhydroxyalkanoate synthesis regulator phasin